MTHAVAFQPPVMLCGSSPVDGPTRADYVRNEWLPMTEAYVTASTLRTYTRRVDTFLNPFLGTMLIGGIMGDDIRRWDRWLCDNGYSDRSIASCRALLNLVLKDAHARGWIAINPMPRFRRRPRLGNAPYTREP